MATKRPKKTGRQNYDWETIKTDYVTSDLSLRAIAEKYRIRPRTVTDRASAESWFATKKEFKKKTTEKAIAKVATRKANQLAKEIEAADKISSVLTKALSDLDQFNRHLVIETAKDDTGMQITTTVEKTFDKLDTRALKEVAQTLKLVEDIKRSLLNIETMEQHNRRLREQKRLEIEEERLKIEQQKANISTGGDEDNCGIMLLPEVLADE